MKKFFIRISIIIAILLSAYFIWSFTGRAKEKETGWSKLPEFKARFEYVEAGADSGKGNIIGIQPYLTATNYSTAFNLEVSLRFYFEQLKREGKLNSKSVVVLPEHIGIWLVLANEKEKVYKASSLNDALKTIKWASVFGYLNGWLKSPVNDKNSYAVLHLKAAKMARQYQQVFAGLAKEYKCRIAAGSLLLPDATVGASNNIQIKPGASLFNTFFLFDTSGAVAQQGLKQEVSSENIFDFNLRDSLAFVSVQSQNVSFATIKSANRFSTADSTTTYTLNKDQQLSNIQQGISLTFNGSLFDKQLSGRLVLVHNDSITVFSSAIGKGRIVNLYLR